MASLGELGRLTPAEYADLNDRVDRFHAAWKPDGSVPLESFVPPPDARHRPIVLVELIKTDMELRAKAGLPIRVEPYLARFPDEIKPDAVPVSLLAEEYRLRHRHADKPDIGEYQRRFRAQFDSLVKHLAPTATEPPPAGPTRGGTIGPESAPGVDNTPPWGPAAATKVSGDRPEPPPPPPPPRSHSGLGSVSASDILPAGLEYKLLRRIGEGAFGEVYEALAPGGFRVAVKRIRRDVSHPASKGELEALEAIKTLSHPFLLQTHAYWVFEDRLVLVMELAEGSLAERIRPPKHHQDGPEPVCLPAEELIPFFEQVAEALDYLHSQNVSHRDVKPENLLLLKGYAKVADFGLARAQEHVMTTVGMEVGTPAYMAPEVCLGKVSLHSDQYSLAATYVKARLGRYLFNTTNRREMEDHHLSTTPDLDPLPDPEQRVLLKALAKKPEDRYPSCAAFARALRQAVLEPPPPPPPPWRRLYVALAALATLVSVVMVAVVIWLLTRPPTPPPPPPPEVTPEPTARLPAGWHPDKTAGTVTVAGKPYWKKLTYPLAGEQLVALLVYPTHPTDPPPFYMLENKITNQVFRAAWERASRNPVSALRSFRERLDPATVRPVLLPGRWRDGAKDRDGKPLGIDGDQAGVPVVGVTLPEAILIAEELGGRVPSYAQWLKAVGMNDRDGLARDSPGPAGPAVEADDPDERLREIEKRGLALGLNAGPWPVGRPTPDRSCFGIHQLVTNGAEWTGDHFDGPRLDLATVDLLEEHTVRVVGTRWLLRDVLTFDRMQRQEVLNRPVPWVKWNPDPKEHWEGESVGFRIVIEPQ